MSHYTLRPISDRSVFLGKHENSLFSAPWPRTEKLLLTEVSRLKGKHLVVECDITESDIRLDGRIRANAHTRTPAVRIAFESIYGPLTYATDKFWEWQDNVRAIALGLEALRRVDRYGITRRGEQYAGWKALPSGSGAAPTGMTSEAAAELLRNYAPANTPLSAAWKAARIATHPDKVGHSRDWNRVQDAARLVGLS